MEMKYLSLDTIRHTSLPQNLNNISITMRGTKRAFDIYFSSIDTEIAFGINITSGIDFTWINTPSGKEKYLSYPTIKKLLYQLRDINSLAQAYLEWIDDFLFSDNTADLTLSYSESSAITDGDTFSDLDDISESSSSSFEDNHYLISALQHKVDQLEHQIQIKNKDLVILDQEIKLRDKEIEILKLKLSCHVDSGWI